ncbi:MAG: pyroglutamyl-peptidase I [Planctomycetota bacterium]
MAGSSGTAAPGVGSDPKAAPPVILLTGYEPFGGADVNPSWEAVKHLDGTSWHGYRLVARELPVVWGAPLPALKKLMTDLQPVAVFSFGQGLPDRFTIETVAHRERGDYPDNDGQQPKEKKIADGAEQYEAGARAVAVEKKLAEKGYPIMASKDAGRYLCEECLYSLEYLHATEFKSIYVQFSHMPAWGNRIGPEKTEVTNAYEKQFVQDTLEAWWATRAGK